MDIIHDFYEIYKYCFFLHIIPQGLANIGLTKRIMQDIYFFQDTYKRSPLLSGAVGVKPLWMSFTAPVLTTNTC